MIGFGIDQVQAEYVAEIKLRNINKEYILKRVQETDALERGDRRTWRTRWKSPPASARSSWSELEARAEKVRPAPADRDHLQPRGGRVRGGAEDTPDYPVTVFLSREGYFKKITPQSLRMSGEQKFKEGDGPAPALRGHQQRGADVLHRPPAGLQGPRCASLTTARPRCWATICPPSWAWTRARASSTWCLPGDYSGHLLFFFENGKCARVELSAYATTSNRRKLTGAYSDKSPLTALLPLTEDRELALISTEPRALLLHTSLLSPKTTRATQGVAVMNMKPRYRLQRVCDFADSGIVNLSRYRVRSIPAAGALLREEDQGREQMTLL